MLELEVPGTCAVIREGEPVHDQGCSFGSRAVRIVSAEGLETRKPLEEIKTLVEKTLNTL